MSDINTAILERLEKVVDSLQDNSVKMGQLLAVHNEKLDKQDKIDEVLFEKVDSVHREVNRKADEIKKGCESLLEFFLISLAVHFSFFHHLHANAKLRCYHL